MLPQAKGLEKSFLSKQSQETSLSSHYNIQENRLSTNLSHQGNASQNYPEIPPYTNQNG